MPFFVSTVSLQSSPVVSTDFTEEETITLMPALRSERLTWAQVSSSSMGSTRSMNSMTVTSTPSER